MAEEMLFNFDEEEDAEKLKEWEDKERFEKENYLPESFTFITTAEDISEGLMMNWTECAPARAARRAFLGFGFRPDKFRVMFGSGDSYHILIHFGKEQFVYTCTENYFLGMPGHKYELNFNLRGRIPTKENEYGKIFRSVKRSPDLNYNLEGLIN